MQQRRLKPEPVIKLKNIFLTFAVGLIFTVSARADTFHFQSGAKQVSLLELYTSEGCSSCPPAEGWLNRLNDSPRLWKDFVPVAFHVDYWDSFGWKDIFSSPAYSERQRDYAQLWHADNVYTPCFVLNGGEWHGWFGRRDVPAGSSEDVGVLEVKSQDTNHWTATFVPTTPTDGNFEIHAALLAGGNDSDVKAGENRGRRLHHEFAALDLIQIGIANHNGIAHGKFILDLPRYSSERTLALAVWVTHPGELLPLQATGGWLMQSSGPAK